MPKKPLRTKVTPKTTVQELGASTLLNDLTKIEIVVYLHLMSLSGRRKTSTLAVKNNELGHHDSATASIALHRLQKRGLVSMDYSSNGKQRTITLS